MVLFAALTLVRALDGSGWQWPLWLALSPPSLFAGVVMVVARLRDRAAGAAPAGQPGRHHPVHGDARPHLLPRGLRPDAVRQPTSRGSTSACPRSRSSSSNRCSTAASWSTSSTSAAAVIAAVLVAGAGAVLPEDAHRPRAARGGRRPPGGAVDRHPAQPDLGDRVVGGRPRRAGGRRRCGAASSACSSRSSLVALKALPVLILGGFTSVPGAIVGGLIIGVGEKLSEVYLGPLVGGGIENWFAYVLALVVPAGPAAGPVRREDHRARLGATHALPRDRPVQDQLREPTSRSSRSSRTASSCWLLLAVAFVVVPLVASEYWLRAILIPFLILSLAASGSTS